MTREQAINYLISSGFTQEQVCEVVRALTYAPTTKNDLGVDLISRADAIKAMQNKAKKLTNEDTINGLCGAVAILFDLPSVTPQEQQTFKWCTDCKEYDQEKHCCHRWSKVIRDTVEEMKQEPRWIPISEKLPEKNVEVLATTEWGAVTIAEMYSVNDWFIHEGATNAETDEIVAWMPLPKPFEPQESEVEDGNDD